MFNTKISGQLSIISSINMTKLLIFRMNCMVYKFLRANTCDKIYRAKDRIINIQTNECRKKPTKQCDE